MGLSSAPSSFQLLMDKILQGLTFKVCLCYLDDILIASETFDQHIDDLNTVFGRLKEAGLKLGPKKCSFAQQSCVFLGHLISSKGIQPPPPERLQAIKDYPSPKSVKELRRVVGLLNWFRKYIPNFSSEIEPMTKLLRKNMKFRWSAEQENAFQKLKNCF
ncbi:Retrovirus-related Pol polyprotein from transposon 297,Retrovirus-related Pol polyprotein from transposon 17.6 [Mytilus coruscus]|uniref:Retrovirus-related Pol polyprotein from transposon 297,Retrovirus-related Pol polyprotein from transposon 17.6 n=1 Tax=Mytilus coruscus TaxID=42192 RepID=A0A6J8CID9_MYTCO|nr:Retrovirus-related Pol polyprotein from transposon 297,Retrovirus-related Pol polyprotein from transposon 17.6 [Mytilus coruscus]